MSGYITDMERRFKTIGDVKKVTKDRDKVLRMLRERQKKVLKAIN